MRARAVVLGPRIWRLPGEGTGTTLPQVVRSKSSSSDFSPHDETQAALWFCAGRALSHSFGSVTRLGELDHVRFLVALVHLHTVNRWGGGRRFHLLCRMGMWRRLDRGKHAFVKACGTRRRDLILSCVERITQNQLNVAFRTRKSEALGIVGRNQECNYRSVLRLARCR